MIVVDWLLCRCIGCNVVVFGATIWVGWCQKCLALSRHQGLQQRSLLLLLVRLSQVWRQVLEGFDSGWAGLFGALNDLAVVQLLHHVQNSRIARNFIDGSRLNGGSVYDRLIALCT